MFVLFQLIADLLNDLPKRFSQNGDINSCFGAALQVAYKLMVCIIEFF